MSKLIRVLSVARLAAYKQSVTDTDALCLQRYVFNLKVSESLYSVLHYLEVGLRNSIHQAITDSTGNDFWFDDTSIISDQRTRKIIGGVKSQLSRQGKPITSGRVIAGLHFGFWRALFYAQYEMLWRSIVKDVFPNAPKSFQQRSQLAPYIDKANKLRNRVFHHEPVWYYQSLQQDHQDMLQVIAWLSQPLYDLTVLCDRFDGVYQDDLAALQSQFESLIK